MNEVSSYSSAPHISVVIPTCHRPADVQRCLDSLGRVSYPQWDILLVDQSDDERTRKVAQALQPALPRLTYRHIGMKGASRARNVGIETTHGEIVAFLDDDCTVVPDWLNQVMATFTRYPEAALVFGSIKSAPHNRDECFVTEYAVEKEHIAQGRAAFLRPDGAAASMCLRRAAAQRVGLFDANLGPGTPFFVGSEENDYSYRCLAAGYGIVRSPSIVVEHHGAKAYRKGQTIDLFLDYAYSVGGTDMKFLRCGHMEALIVIASHSLYFMSRIRPHNVLLRRGPSNVDRLLMYVRGLCASFQLGVDRRQGLYRVAPDQPASEVHVGC